MLVGVVARSVARAGGGERDAAGINHGAKITGDPASFVMCLVQCVGVERVHGKV